MKISFCTTCANRLFQFEETFGPNLREIARHPNTEWIVLNMNSADALDSYLSERLPDLPSRFTYASTIAPRPWHLSVAKNRAHTLGAGDVLVNLDCDNFIGDAIDTIESRLTGNILGLHLWSGVFRDGTCGRIALRREAFYELGGYDEEMLPMSYQDLDLLKRAVASGMPILRAPPHGSVSLTNDKGESVKHCEGGAVGWGAFNRRNKKISAYNIEHGRLVANRGREWGRWDVRILNGMGDSD